MNNNQHLSTTLSREDNVNRTIKFLKASAKRDAYHTETETKEWYLSVLEYWMEHDKSISNEIISANSLNNGVEKTAIINEIITQLRND